MMCSVVVIEQQFSTVDGQMDKQTDTHTKGHSIYCASMALSGKKDDTQLMEVKLSNLSRFSKTFYYYT